MYDVDDCVGCGQWVPNNDVCGDDEAHCPACYAKDMAVTIQNEVPSKLWDEMVDMIGHEVRDY